MSRSCRLTLVRLATNAATAATYSSRRVCDPEVRRPDRDRGCRRRPRRPRASGGVTMNDAPQEYIARALSNEAAVVANAQASTRNQILNRSAFKLGTIPGAQLDTVVGALLPAARENGYVAEHGEHSTRKVIESGFQNGQRKQRKVPRLNRAERRCMAFGSDRAATSARRRQRSRHCLTAIPRGQPFHRARSQTRMESLTS